jgi:hypothetical protein
MPKIPQCPSKLPYTYFLTSCLLTLLITGTINRYHPIGEELFPAPQNAFSPTHLADHPAPESTTPTPGAWQLTSKDPSQTVNLIQLPSRTTAKYSG